MKIDDINKEFIVFDNRKFIRKDKIEEITIDKQMSYGRDYTTPDTTSYLVNICISGFCVYTERCDSEESAINFVAWIAREIGDKS